MHNEIPRASIQVAVLIVAVLGLSLLTSAPSAQALSDSCGGSRIETKNLKEINGDLLSQMQVNYNSGNGKNCAMNVKFTSASTYGVSDPMGIELVRCTQSTEGNVCTEAASQVDSGNYKYWAGAVKVSAENKCIYVSAWTVGVFYSYPMLGPWYEKHTNPAASHCG